MKKTLFITDFHALIARNVLVPILPELSQKYKVVILVPDFKLPYFKRMFEDSNIICEGVSPVSTRKGTFFDTLALMFLPTQTARIKKSADLFRGGNCAWLLRPFAEAVAFWGRSRLIVSLFRWIDIHSSSAEKFDELFLRYGPCAIFSTDVQHKVDVALLQEAKCKKIRTVGMVRSWDNLTAKGLLRVLPDTLIVQNELLKQEAIRFHFVEPDCLRVAGVPHYDRYRTEPPKRELDTFCDHWGFDPKKPIVLFAPFGDRYITYRQTDEDILRTLSEFDVNILVRLPPSDTTTLPVVWRGAKSVIAFERTGVRSWKERPGIDANKSNEISAKDDETLMRTFVHTTLLVTGASTLCIDAAVFDVPVVLVGFDGNRKMPYEKSVRRYYDYDHFQPVLRSGGVRLVSNEYELKNAIRAYMKDPSLDREGRKTLVETECYKNDAKSTERLVKILFTELEKSL